MVMVFMMDGELTQFLAVKFAPAVGADPGKEFECLLARGLFPLRPVVRCHARLEVNRNVIGIYSTARREQNPVSVASGPAEAGRFAQLDEMNGEEREDADLRCVGALLLA
jgi:hypothetical protein